jgi:hypothetical protein
MSFINNAPAQYANSKNEVITPKRKEQQQQQQYQQHEQLVLSGQPFRLFIESCRTTKTKETYTYSLKSYMIYRNLSSVESLIAEDPKTAQSQIIEYISWLREKGLSWQTRVINAAALKHFYEMNDIIIGKRSTGS